MYELFKWMCGGGGSLYKNAASESRLTRRICPIHFRDHGIEETIATQNENGIIMTMGDREKAKFMAFSSHRPSGEQQSDGNKHCEKQKGEKFETDPADTFSRIWRTKNRILFFELIEFSDRRKGHFRRGEIKWDFGGNGHMCARQATN